MNPPNVSVIVTTHNWPEALTEVLRGLAAQHTRPLEVLIADDGSAPETARRIASLAATLPFPLQHVWQEHRGFRAGRARNRAAALARGDYLVFLDGDCVPLPPFIGGHARLAEPGRFVAGQRILLSPEATRRWLHHGARLSEAGPLQWLAARWRGDVNRLAPLFPLLPAALPRPRSKRWQGVQTCNLGLWRSDFEAVNGFDAAFVGWGHEDADLAVRLIRRGLTRKSGRFATPVLHLWHPPAARDRARDNRSLLDATLRGERPVVAVQGLREDAAEAP